jgi:virulence factor
MRVAVVGLGDIASKAYLPLLARWPGLELMLVSRRAETVSLEADVDVFVEKPPTMHSDETLRLGEQADAAGRVLMVSFNRRYAPLHVAARELWGARVVNSCAFTKHRAGARYFDLFSNYTDDTIHAVDTLRFFAGDGEAVGTTAQMRDGRLVGAVSVIALKTGGHGVVVTSLEAGRWSESYSVHGAMASLEVEAFQRLRLIDGDGERVTGENAGTWGSKLEARGFPQQIAHFLECVQSRQTPRTSALEAYRTQRLVEDLVKVATIREAPPLA